MDKDELVRVRNVEVLHNFWVRLEFTNGACKDIDLSPYLRGPIFEPLRNDPHLFCAVKVDHGTVVWDNGADIDPDVLYLGLKPAWMGDAESSDAQQKAA